jgi:hypothetical protein
VLQRPLIAVVVPVTRRGEVRFLLFMGLLPERIATLFTAQHLDPKWVAVVFDRKGHVIARVPDGSLVGRTPGADLVAAIRHDHEGWLRSTTFEGAPAYFAFARVPHADWSVALGIPVAAAYASASRSLSPILAGGLVAVVLGLLLATMLGRRIAAPLATLATAARASDAAAVLRGLAPAVAEVADVGRALRDASESRKAEQLERQ